MQILSPDKQWKDYELIDSGDFEKLERFGRFVVRRPEPKAVWAKSLSDTEWEQSADSTFKQGAGFNKSGKEDSGTWFNKKNMAEQWTISYKNNDLNFKLRLGLTAFKHVGVFPEQAPNWDYIYKTIKDMNIEKPRVLNLFAYTGGASLSAKLAGADVVHLDSVKQVVSWARENMELSKLDNIRWIIEDAMRFMKREAKRGNKYNGIILDPPAYGHGTDGEKWKLDENIFEMLTNCKKTLDEDNSFLLLNLYSNGFSAIVADTLTNSVFSNISEKTFGELVLEDRFGKRLPLSVFSRIKMIKK
ncbi:MAG: class I SAM-dependent methyltransferase [Prevotellaceae bacterium]|jgi:23S rRNA (cytosine1962-C5)-methyltransferase|nr:class I SAM-dependent methyltransferase [Prevotellaceae bacterium]